MDVKKVDTLVYFATMRGLEIFNWHATNPQFLSRFPTDGIAYSLDIAGNYVYITDHYKGLCIVDVSNPTSPELIGGYDTDGKAEDVVVKDSIAYLADWGNGLVIIDISDPAAPYLLGHCANIGLASSVIIEDSLVYVGTFDSTLMIINAADPSNPFVVGEFPPPDPFVYGADAIIDDTLAYINCGFWLQGKKIHFAVVDVKDPANPVFVAGLTMPGTNRGIEKVGNYVYTNAQMDGVYIIDITDPKAPFVAGKYYGSFSFGSGYIIYNTFLLATHFIDGFSIADISNPQKPIKVYHHRDIKWMYFTSEDSLDYLYIVGQLGYDHYFHYSILKTVDITDPVNPEVCGELFFLGRASLCEGSIDYPYLEITIRRGNPVRETLYTVIIDVSNPYAPELIRFVEGGGVTEMHIPYLYSLNDSIIKVGDIYDPLFWVDSIPLSIEGYDVVINDTIAYLTVEDSLLILDIASGNTLGSCYHGRPNAVNISLDFPYVAVSYTPFSGSSYGFLLFDVSNSSLPSVLTDTLIYAPLVYPNNVYVMGCELKDTLLYFGRSHYGFDIWKIGYPDTIYRILTQETPYVATYCYPHNNSNIHVKDDVIFVLDYGSLELYRFDRPGIEE